MSTIKATTLSNLAGSQTISTDRVAQGTAFAWAYWNAVGTATLLRAYNVSSITDNGVGQISLNLATTAPNTPVAVASTNGSGAGGVCIIGITVTSTTAINTQSTNTASTVDNTLNYCAVFV